MDSIDSTVDVLVQLRRCVQSAASRSAAWSINPARVYCRDV